MDHSRASACTCLLAIGTGIRIGNMKHSRGAVESSPLQAPGLKAAKLAEDGATPPNSPLPALPAFPGTEGLEASASDGSKAPYSYAQGTLGTQAAGSAGNKPPYDAAAVPVCPPGMEREGDEDPDSESVK